MLWGFSFNFADMDRLLEFIIWLLSLVFIVIPFFLISLLVQKKVKLKDSDIRTKETLEDYVDKRSQEIEEALSQYKK